MATCTGLLNTGMITCFQNRKERTLILFFGCSRQQCNNTWIFPQAWQHYLDTKLPLITLHEISINQITWDYHQSSYKKLPLISWFAIVLCSGIPLLKKKPISLTNSFYTYVFAKYNNENVKKTILKCLLPADKQLRSFCFKISKIPLFLPMFI